jgi:cation/acetate symporter
MGIAFLTLLDRLGLPEPVLAWLAPAIGLLSLMLIGLSLRSSRISEYHAAGRHVPSSYAALAITGMAAALFLMMEKLLAPSFSSGTAIGGLALGLICAALISGPLLRRTGAFSCTELVNERFANKHLRLGVAFALASASAALTVEIFSTADELMQIATQAGPLTRHMLLGITLAFLLLPAGVAGAVWGAAAAFGMVLATTVVPLVVMTARGATLPLPVLGDSIAFSQGLAQSGLTDWRPLMILCLATGVMGLAPLLLPSIAATRSTEARAGGLSAVAWLALLLVLVLCGGVMAYLALQGAAGLRPTDLPDFLLEASRRGFVTICGAHPASVAQMRDLCAQLPGYQGTLRSGDLAAMPLYLVTAVAELRGYGAAFTALSRAALLCLAIALTAAATLTAAISISHDLIHLSRAKKPLTSRRLALTRLVLIVSISALAITSDHLHLSHGLLLGLSLALSASLILPLIVLTLVPRATEVEALACFGMGAVAIAASIFVEAPNLSFTQLVQSGAACGALAFGVGAALSLRHHADPTSAGSNFVAQVLHGSDDAMHSDSGA